VPFGVEDVAEYVFHDAAVPVVGGFAGGVEPDLGLER
jgi:hypothetical protein